MARGKTCPAGEGRGVGNMQPAGEDVARGENVPRREEDVARGEGVPRKGETCPVGEDVAPWGRCTPQGAGPAPPPALPKISSKEPYR